MWGIIGIIAAVAATAVIGFWLYNSERTKQRRKEIICAVSGHDLEGCFCKRCGKEDHEWDGCLCTRCKKKRDRDHKWHRCICLRCGAKRDEQHDWVMENNDENASLKVCKICTKIETAENEGDEEE
jgi:hypothetical protein